jgi:hypothetical protein
MQRRTPTDRWIVCLLVFAAVYPLVTGLSYLMHHLAPAWRLWPFGDRPGDRLGPGLRHHACDQQATRLGTGLMGHSQKMTVAARATAEKKTVGQLS